MKTIVSDIAFTPAVKAQQERLGSRKGYSRMEENGGWSYQLHPSLLNQKSGARRAASRNPGLTPWVISGAPGRSMP